MEHWFIPVLHKGGEVKRDFRGSVSGNRDGECRKLTAVRERHVGCGH